LSLGTQTHHDRLVMGLDGGGTKTVAWLAAHRPGQLPDVLGKGLAGPGNLRAVGFELACAHLLEAVRAAVADAQLEGAPLAAACLALAGAGRESDRARVLTWARSQSLAVVVDVVNDAEPLLVAGTPESWGIALIAGTGSLAYGRDAQGIAARVGGWGYLFGDEGSGYAVATAGLRAAAQAADGRGAATSLLPRLLERLAVSRPEQLVEAVYQGPSDRRRIADLAPVVVEAALEGDAVAEQLVHAAAYELAKMVAVLSQRLQLPGESIPLALAGTWLLRSSLLQSRLLQQLCDSFGLQPLVQSVPEPVWGAVLLASRL
jgi:N-acetylglucosamine kinase-like BadF-type ATPase